MDSPEELSSTSVLVVYVVKPSLREFLRRQCSSTSQNLAAYLCTRTLQPHCEAVHLCNLYKSKEEKKTTKPVTQPDISLHPPIPPRPPSNVLARHETILTGSPHVAEIVRMNHVMHL